MQNKLHWDIIDSKYFGFIEGTSECLDCGYEGSDWAECDSFLLEDGSREVFCPNCKSSNYYLTSAEERLLCQT